MKKRSQPLLLFREDWCEMVEKHFPADMRFEVIKAIVNYNYSGVLPTDDQIRLFTCAIFSQVDRDKEAYEQKCSRSKERVKKHRNANNTASMTDACNDCNACNAYNAYPNINTNTNTNTKPVGRIKLERI